MTQISVGMSYSEAQHRAFFESRAKFNFYPKGRRVGFTRGGIQAATERAIEGRAQLWGDTIAPNIRRYVERYVLPVLRRQSIPHQWNVVEKTLKFPFSGGHIDFRSADNPQGWEGFGYHDVYLNEAGIILEGTNGEYLYRNAVLPMLMDFPESQLYAFGAPKGLNLFHELYQIALGGAAGYHQETFSSYDNPFVPRESIAALEADMRKVGGDDLVAQEIYGKFVATGGDANRVIPLAWVEAAQQRWRERRPPQGRPDAIGGDVARGGEDKSVLASRWGSYYTLLAVPGSQTPDGPSFAALVLPRVGPHTRVNIDVVAVGTSAYDFTRGQHPPTFPINGAARSGARDRTGLLRFANLRAEVHWRMREALDPQYRSEVCLPPDAELAADLTAPTWKLGANGIQIEDKDAIRARLKRSPDKGEAVMYANFVVPGSSGADHQLGW